MSNRSVFQLQATNSIHKNSSPFDALKNQNDLLMKYIEENNSYSYDPNEDLCMISSTIMLDKNLTLLN